MRPFTCTSQLRLISLAATTAAVAATVITNPSGSAMAASLPSYQQLAGSAAPFKGYDNMTGIGTPNGQLFISGLRTIGG